MKGELVWAEVWDIFAPMIQQAKLTRRKYYFSIALALLLSIAQKIVLFSFSLMSSASHCYDLQKQLIQEMG